MVGGVVVAPVVVWVVSIGASWANTFDVFPIETKLSWCAVITRVTRVSSCQSLPNVVEVSIERRWVVRTIAVSITITIPTWDTTGCAFSVSCVCTITRSWVSSTVWIVSNVFIISDVPSVSCIIFQLNVISVGEHVVLACSIVVCWVSVSATVDTVHSNL